MTAKIHNLVCATCSKEFTWQWSPEKRGRPPRRCDECIAEDPRGRKMERQNGQDRLRLGQVINRLSEFDKSELDFIKNRMGSSALDAIATSIRVYAAMLRRG